VKPMNMPERVTKRRAEAYARLMGVYPEGYSATVLDTKFRKGRNSRLKAAQKFLIGSEVVRRNWLSEP
jgi:hypothetical protein